MCINPWFGHTWRQIEPEVHFKMVIYGDRKDADLGPSYLWNSV
jgi:hypothetical protein